MRVVRIETVNQDFRAIRPAVAIVVDQQGKIRLGRQVYAFRSQFETDWHMQAIGEYRLLVGPAVVVGILENDQLIVRPLVAGPVVRVGRNDRHPEASLVVEGHLHRIAQVRKFALRSEQIDLIAFRKGEFVEGLVDLEEIDLTVVVGYDLAEFPRRTVVHRLSGGAALSDVVDLPIAQLRHLTDFLDFLRIIHVAVRLVAASIYVNAIEDSVVIKPIPILILYHFVHRLMRYLLLGLHFAVERLDEDFGKIAVAFVGQGKPVDGLGIAFLGVELPSRLEEIDKANVPLVGDPLHGSRVGLEARILFLAVRQVPLLG